MITHGLPSEKFEIYDRDWPFSHWWAITKMPCPAYCCACDGSVLSSNAAAQRLWGWSPPDNVPNLWDGFAALHSLDGQLLNKSMSPAALAASGDEVAEMELIAACHDGQLRRVIVRAKTIRNIAETAIGVLVCLIDVSERRHWEQEARGVTENRTAFLKVLAHELRNPLSPIMSAAALLRKKNSAVTASTLADMVERQTRTLARFISDLLDASRLENLWELKVEPRSCFSSEVLQRTMDEVNLVLESRSQSLNMEIPDSDILLWCDLKRVAQALSSVLLNASAFTPDGGEINISLSHDDTILYIEISDQGPGIQLTDLPHIFKPFEQRAGPPGRAASGAGIGLAISKSICAAHGGTISLRNNESGTGATCSLALPIVSSSAG
jgi:signal transduction histidine kinase